MGRTELNGVDIASYQAGIQPAGMKTTDFVIVKFTQGTDYLNPHAEDQYGAAKQAGKLLGAYHYGGGKDPVAEARFFVSQIRGKIGECILALDWEGKQNGVFGTGRDVAWCLTFLDEVYRLTGVRAFIYMSKSVCRRYDWTRVAENYPLWCAQYANRNTTGYQDDPWTDNKGFGAWEKDTIRQYSSSGRITGYGKDIDLDRAYMTEAEWRWAAGGGKVEQKDQRSAIVGLAKALVGTKEGSSTHHSIIDRYNAHTPLPRGYRVKYDDAWCATFISYLAIAMDCTDIIPIECSCPRMVELAKSMGIWVEDDGYTPDAGDIVLHDWQDSGIGENYGSPDHIGLVTETNGKDFVVTEGNYKDSVCTREMTVGGRYIRGYIVPRYTGESPRTGQNEAVDDLHTVKWSGRCKVDTKVYRQPDTASAPCSFSPLAKGTPVGVCKRVGQFYFCKEPEKGLYGYIHRSHIEK